MSLLSKSLYCLYAIRSRLIRNVVITVLYKIEGGDIYSMTLRKIFKDYHNLEIGMYTHGYCFVPGAFAPYTKIGRYCSIAANVKAFNRNHPMEYKSTHALFFNPSLGVAKEDKVKRNKLIIGNDVWIGEGALIKPDVREIGDGAVIGAGAVVHKRVPPYAVIVGNPARVVRYRFSQEVVSELLASQWWEKDIDVLKQGLQEYQVPFEKLFIEMKGEGKAGGGDPVPGDSF